MLALNMTQAKATTAAAKDAWIKAAEMTVALCDQRMAAKTKAEAARAALAQAQADADQADADQADLAAKHEASWAEVRAAEKERTDAQAVEKRLAAEASSCPRAKFAALCGGVLEVDTPISVESLGDKWVGVVKADGLLVNGFLYRSPGALGKAHASRITANHPKSTSPGSGWVYIMVEDGPHKGKTIEKAFKDHFGLQ